jgi:predicted enzyme related to lactoylglutathione lyase
VSETLLTESVTSAGYDPRVMSDPNFILLFVENPAASAAFYSTLLGRTPVEMSPTFAMFALASGLKLGLWSRHTAEPAPTAAGGGVEIGIAVTTAAEVRTVHETWKARGVPILQPVTQMDFGLTFVGTDPDGHRLRVFYPEEST